MRPAITIAIQAGTRFTYPGGMKGWVDLAGLLYTEIIIRPIIITKAKITVTLSRKNVTGALYSHRNVTKYGTRTFALSASIQRAKVTHSSSGKEPSSAPCEKTQVTSQPWPTQAVRSTLSAERTLDSWWVFPGLPVRIDGQPSPSSW